MPAISVIIPCYNEEATIGLLLESVYTQTCGRDGLEVVIADGGSTDGTLAAIERFTAAHPGLEVRVVQNGARSIPAGLNQALRAARGEFIVRLDAHSAPAPDYIERCVAALQAGLGDNVGGVWNIQPGGPGWVARSIAVAAGHPLGAGDARYRVGGAAQAVDTVPFGAYRRALAERLGYYDETLLTNEDYEFNVRLRRSGGVIWMDPQISTRYFARPSLGALARQYGRYGYWKARMLRRYPDTLRWRQMLPPLFVAGVLALALAGLFIEPARWLLAAGLGFYLLVLAAAGVQAAWKHRGIFLAVGLPLAIAVMHFAWGGAFLWSLIAYEHA